MSLPIIAGDSVVNSIVQHFDGYPHYILILQLVFLEFEYHYTLYLIYVSFTARSCLHCEITVQCLIYCTLITWVYKHIAHGHTLSINSIVLTACIELTVVLLIASTAQLYIRRFMRKYCNHVRNITCIHTHTHTHTRTKHTQTCIAKRKYFGNCSRVLTYILCSMVLLIITNVYTVGDANTSCIITILFNNII